MKSRVYGSITAVLFLLAEFNICGQKLVYPESQPLNQWFQRFAVFDGKGGSCVTSVLADSRGFIWFGKENGLFRFDGSDYLSFLSADNDSSLYGTVVLSIFEDPDGIIWAGTYSALNRIDVRTGKVRHFFPDKACLPGDNNSITGIHSDRNGNLWLLTKKDVYVFNRITEKFTAYNLDSLAWNTAQQNIYLERERFCHDSEGRIWVATNNGLYKLENGLWGKAWPSAGKKNGKGNYHVYCVEEDRAGNIWFGTHEDGLLRIDRSDKVEVIGLPAGTQSGTDRYPKRVSAIYCADTAGVWVSCNKVVAEYDNTGNLKRSWSFFIMGDKQRNSNAELFVNRIFPGKDNSLWFIWISQGIIINFFPGREIFTLNGVPNWIDFSCDQDREGNLWIGSIYSGLHCLVSDSLRYWVRNVEHASGPEGYNRSRMAGDEKGNLWLVNRKGMIFRIRSPFSEAVPFEEPDSLIFPWKDVTPLSVLCDPGGEINFGCINNILVTYDPATGKFSRNDLNEVHFSGFEMLARDSRGNLWLVNPYTAVYRLEAGHDKIEKVIDYTLLPGNLPGANLWDLLVDKNDDLWFSTNYGIYWYSSLTGEIHEIRSPDEAGKKYAEWFLRIMEDNDHNIWALNSFRGLYRYDPDQGIFIAASRFDDLNGLYFHNLNCDKNGRFFLFHNNTMRIFRPGQKEFRDVKFTRLYNDLNALRLSSGEMAVLNGQNLMIFPVEIPVNKSVSPVCLTELLVNNIKYNVLYPQSESVSKLRNIELDHRQNDLSIRFASLNFRQPEMNRFRYFMEGMDRDTVEAQSPEAEYINMQPGRYRFWFTGSNNDNIWNPEGGSLDIRIHPPFYRTALAYVVYILSVIALAVIFIRIRTSRLLREKMRLEVEVSQRTSELSIKNLQLEEADRTKTRFFTNISHEIRTPLSLILGPIDNLIKEYGEDEKEGRIFEMMKRNGQKLQQLINQLLDISRLDSGKMKIILSETDIIKDLRILVYEFLSLAETRNIRYLVEVPDKEHIAFADIDKTEKIISNLLSNAFKFTHEGGCVCCKILIRKSDHGNGQDILEIRVMDTGPGIAPGNIEKIFDRFYRVEDHCGHDATGTGIGLSLTREFVSLLHGDINVQSTPGERTEFIVTIPLGKSHLSDDEYIIADVDDLERMKPHLLHDIVKAGKTTLEEGKEEEVKILVVEDNRDLRNFISVNMGQYYRIVEAEDGKEGANLALTIIPDLVITDLMMPGMDGMSLCRLLKNDERTSHIPVIMLTARATEEEKIEGLMAGADDYIIKPFNIKELKVRISNILEQREKLRQKYSNHFAFSLHDGESASVDDLFLKKIYNIIKENMRDFDFDAGALHEKAGMSRVHLFRKLKVLTGLSPGMLIRNIRLETAATYLVSHSGNITEIANSVGISNPSYFTKCFRKYFKVTPREYAASANHKI
ncbi:MAG TPA: two-component regulator propeller domain-containing protein [Bacteroidales bacterium]|nr:two-component regulator propeller domain-containing protein [Bacteroidales bacterium]HPJ59743.1 two-component regulator propeller domain-containing protein [Bacteroidales bacterium]HRW84068.1 two-component regulator propeller domain-containing protein [Bacteroidales bacterium]